MTGNLKAGNLWLYITDRCGGNYKERRKYWLRLGENYVGTGAVIGSGKFCVLVFWCT